LSVEWYRHASEKISSADRRWMRSLHRSVRFDLNGRSVRIVHGGVKQINRFIFPSTPEPVKREELNLAGTDILIGGHCGLPFGQLIDHRACLNAGVIGLPANDGTRDGWYLLLTPERDRIRCSWRRLKYNAVQAHEGMRAAGLSEGYAETLLSGLWPSLDVLPPAEKKKQGERIQLPDLIL